jgi:hypothetical protein
VGITIVDGGVNPGGGGRVGRDAARSPRIGTSTSRRASAASTRRAGGRTAGDRQDRGGGVDRGPRVDQHRDGQGGDAVEAQRRVHAVGADRPQEAVGGRAGRRHDVEGLKVVADEVADQAVLEAGSRSA